MSMLHMLDMVGSIYYQDGHQCKTVAIANIDTYYANSKGWQQIPYRKNNKKTSEISIREIVKKHGSQQGEISDLNVVLNIFKELGYKVDILDNNENLEGNIIRNICNNIPMFILPQYVKTRYS